MKNIRLIFLYLSTIPISITVAQDISETSIVHDTNTTNLIVDSVLIDTTSSLKNLKIDSSFSTNSIFGLDAQKSFDGAVIDTSDIIYAWSLEEDYLTPKKFEIDTNLVAFQIYNPIDRQFIYATTLGNTASASLPNTFFDRDYHENLLYLSSYSHFFSTYENTYFINTRKPFSHLYYYNGASKPDKEEQIELFHSQNINPKFNFGFNLKILSDLGKYEYLKVKNKNFKAFSSYSGKNYNLHATFNYNKYQAEENGGIIDSLFLSTDRQYSKTYPTNFNGDESKNPNLAYVFNKVRYIDGMISQKVKLFTFGNTTDTTRIYSNIAEPAISHVFMFRRTSKLYEEGPTNDPVIPIYRNTYSNPHETFDSIAHLSISNKIQLDFKTKLKGKVSIGVFGAIGHEFEKFSYYSLLDSTVYDTTNEGLLIVEKDTLYGGKYYYYLEGADTMKYQILPFKNGDTIADINKVTNHNNLYITGGFYGRFWTYFQSLFSAKLYFAGYKAGQTQIDGLLKSNLYLFSKPYIFQIQGSIENIKPSYQLDYYYSNNYIWESNNFDFISRINLSSKIAAPSNKFELSGDYALIRNHVYLTDSIPVAYNSTLNIVAMGIEKEFVFWKLHFYNKLIYQISENDNVVELPTLIYYNSTYIDHTWKFKITGGKIRTMLGFDVRYASEFNAYGYNPAMAVFYQLNSSKIGNYPFLDIWLNVRLKRTRFFAKFEHYNSTMWNRKDYYLAASYPAKPSVFKFGISWTFYD